MLKEWLKSVRKSIPPETEYGFGSAWAILSALWVSKAGFLPKEFITPEAETANQEALLLSALITFELALPLIVDGAYRIATERLPYIKAFLQIYIPPLLGLNKSSDQR